MIKLKLENCLNVLKIVSKKPVDILLLIKDKIISTITVFIMAGSLFTICYTWVFSGFNLIIAVAITNKN